MKKLKFLTTVLLLSIFQIGAANTDRKMIKSELKKATIFKVGATLSHTTNEINLSPGTHHLAIQQVANFLDVGSIQIKNTLDSSRKCNIVK